MRNSLWCYYRQLIISIALEKCKKECDLVQGFCPLKIKIAQFPTGLCFKLSLPHPLHSMMCCCLCYP